MEASRRPRRAGPWRVFLSHTSELGDQPGERSFVSAAESAVVRSGHAVVDMTYFAARDAEPADTCLHMVGTADVYVGIIGERYGSPVRDRPDRSYTELEFEVATDRALPRLVFLVDERPDAAAGQPAGHRARQEAFRRRLLQESGLTACRVSSPADLEVRLVHALGELRADADVPGPSRPPEPRAGIPPEPTAYFVGREAELSDLRQVLARRGRVIVSGLGGIGKTQLVARYAQRHQDDYPDGVFWLRAHHEVGLVGDLASVAWRIGLAEREDRVLERQVAAVLRWLREHPRWLLVLDDLEPAMEERVRYWLPPGLPGHVLGTSRTPMWPARVGLEPLGPEVASRFLLERTGQADAEAAGAVAESLWGLPLALEQAAAYLDASGRDLGSYAELLRTRLVELMAQGRPEDYPRTVVTTLRLSFERLDGEHRAAAGLLRVCAFLAPNDIPIPLVQEGAEGLPAELRPALVDDVELDRTVAALRRYSLVDRKGDGLQVHPLVQAAIRDSLDADLGAASHAAAILLLLRGFPEDAHDHPELWPLCARLLPHARAVEQLADAEGAEPRALAALLDRVGIYLGGRGELTTARSSCERALAIRERVLGRGHPETAESLGNLACLLMEQGELDAAGPLFEESLAIRERALGPDHPATALACHDLAEWLHARGDVAGARRLNARALDIRERVLGADHPVTAHSLHDRAWLLLDGGEPAAARDPVERALAIRERTLGPDHPRTTWSLHLMALVLRAGGEAEAARALLERVLAARERVLGADHHETAWALHDLAELLRDAGEIEDARLLVDRAVAVRERALGSGHRLTEQSRLLLAELEAGR